MKTTLAIRMVERANRDNLPTDHVLRIKTQEFESATEGFYSEPQTVTVGKFMMVYAKAKRAWCEYSGEPLI